MAYQERPPRPLLGPAVESVWSFSDDTGAFVDGSLHRVFPDGCIELIVHRGRPFEWKPDKGPLRTQPRAFVVGQLSEPMWLLPRGTFEAVGIRLRPGGARAALGDDLNSLADGVTPLDALWGADAIRMADRVSEAPSAAHAQRFLEDVLAERLSQGRAPHPATLQVIEDIMRARGQVRVDSLARDAGWTERHLERRFTREVGILPKNFARTVRFQHLLEVLSSLPEDDWAGLAWECGFSDQSHLIREFRRFTGATPAHLREEALKVARQFISPERLRRYFAGRPPAPLGRA